MIHKLISKKWSGKRWLSAVLALVVVASGFPFTAPGTASAAPVPDKPYVSFKYDSFSSTHPLKGLLEFSNILSSPPVGWITEDGKEKLRLAGEVKDSGGSAFNKQRVSLDNDRSFSTYFSFQMRNKVPGGTGCCGLRADGLVFVMQTASSSAGSTGGGLGYENVKRSIGIEYDTHLNGPNDSNFDPVAVNGNAGGSQASHVAYDEDGVVTHPNPNTQAGKDRRNVILANLSSSDMDLANGIFHSWIDYDGVNDKLRVYLIKEGTGSKFLVPVMKAGTNEKVQDGSAVEISAFPHLNVAGKLEGTRVSNGTPMEIQPILEVPNVDLSKILTQDEVFAGFTAATGGSYQNHDIWKWYFNNDSGLIVPDVGGGANIEQAPTKIQILNKGPFTYPTQHQGSNHNGIKVNGARATVTSQVYMQDGSIPPEGYPVTFSLYLVTNVIQVSTGKGDVPTQVRADDPDILMQNDQYVRVKKSYPRANGQTQEVWEITVPTDANGQAKIDLFNLGNPHLTNVKARIGGDLAGYTAPHGGGLYDEAPVLFGSETPKVTGSEVSDDRRRVEVEFNIPVKYDPDKTGGFWLTIPGKNDPLPLVIDKYATAEDGSDDPFRLILKLDPDKVSPNTIIPPNVVPVLHYGGDPNDPGSTEPGSVKDRSGIETLKNFPTGNGTDDVDVVNRFAPESQAVLNDENRDTIRVNFPNELKAPQSGVEQAFKVEITAGGVKKLVDIASIDWDGSDPKSMGLKIDPAGLDASWNGKIPANAQINLIYRPDDVPNGTDKIQKTNGDRLDRFIHPVVNQIQPTQAIVVPGATRNQVKVKFPNALLPTGADLHEAIKLLSDSNVIGVDNVDWDAQYPDTLVLTLNPNDLATAYPDGKIPYESDGGSPVLSLTYDPSLTSAPLSDHNGQQLRILGPSVYPGDFPVANQKTFNPTQAKVNDDQRNQVIVDFQNPVLVNGTPSLQVIVGGDTANPIAVTGITGSGTPQLTLTLDKPIDYNKNVQLVYGPSTEASIVDQGNPTGLVLRPLGPSVGGPTDYPVENQFGPVRAVVTEDATGRNKIEVTFPENIVNPQGSIPEQFEIVFTPDISQPQVSVTVAVYELGWDAGKPGQLILKLDPQDLANKGFPNGIPPEADVKLNYTVPTATTPIKSDTHDLGKLILFPVENGEYEPANLDLTASPNTIIGDGISHSILTAAVTKQNGDPVANTKVVFSVPTGYPGHFIDPNTNLPVASIEATTDATGHANVVFYSDQIIGTNTVDIPITAKVRDHLLKLRSERQITVHFAPATVSGVIVTNGAIVPGATVTITDPATGWSSTIVTGSDGSYKFVVPDGNKPYTMKVTLPPVSGVSSTFTQIVNVGNVTGAGNQNFPSEETITGIIGLQTSTGGVKKWFENTTTSHLMVRLKDSSGSYLNNGATGENWFPLEGSGSGVFTANGVALNEDYQFEVWYKIEVYDENGPTGVYKEVLINGKTDPSDATKTIYPVVRVTRAGELSIVQDLVDPYGKVMNGSNGLAPIPGATVTLYYWDTGLPVYLPPILGFDPNDNASPVQNTDALGDYAYMVYPNTDYKIVVTAAGFPTYTSGKISVGTAIVKHDVILYRSSSSGGGAGGGVTPPTTQVPEKPETGKPNLTVNLSTEKSIVEENSAATIHVDYLNDGTAVLKNGEIQVTIPDGAVVVDADGGKVIGNTITWTVKDLGAGKKGSYAIKLKFPTATGAEKIVELKAQGLNKDGELAKPDSARTSIKVMMFSNRYGDVEHIRYILGHPDGKFKTQNTLSRAELAAIVARLINGGHTTKKAEYSDVTDHHWANGYIRIVTDNGIFTGFKDGTFHPDAPVSREELAVVMARYLKLENSDPINPHFTDVQGRWSASAIEALYRNGMVNGYVDGTFKPSNSIIRSEAVTLINKMLFRGPLLNVKPTFPDVNEKHWAFGQVEEASHSHKATRTSAGENFIETLKDDVK
ncbi:S-layer homology domain-containing protein [Cohnella terricola]|uniref:S-layer homology domain-containing protein n=1 Tax=Cohnella terricola TaxID=1289167 RepID=A0A559J548_9BACL|nr:S-layer homology domain-containing protein [Cohnella terricola]TVX95000.1 hypothetical protein FPZ45_24255 [Cohnella terricola]